MASIVADILADLVETLRKTGKFALVTLGDAGSSTQVPRAEIACEGQESFRPDDATDARWLRLRVTVTIRARSTDIVEATRRVNELGEQAAAAVLEDPFRGSRCRHLPIGRATEVGQVRASRAAKRPETELAIDLRCHLEVPETG